MDYVAGKHKGFCFVEFADPDDAAECIFNLDGSELLGRAIRVSVAQPNQVNKLLQQPSSGTAADGGTAKKTSKSRGAIWEGDEWFRQHATAGGGAEEESAEMKAERETKARDLPVLRKEP